MIQSLIPSVNLIYYSLKKRKVDFISQLFFFCYININFKSYSLLMIRFSVPYSTELNCYIKSSLLKNSKKNFTPNIVANTKSALPAYSQNLLN